MLEVADEALLGTAAIEDPSFLRDALRRHRAGSRSLWTSATDVRALDGWRRTAGMDAVAVARRMVDAGAMRLVVTDTGRDGTLAGPNVELLGRLRAALPGVTLVAAGGIGR